MSIVCVFISRGRIFRKEKKEWVKFGILAPDCHRAPPICSWCYIHLLDLAADEDDPVTRLKLVVAFAIGGLRQQVSFGRFGMSWRPHTLALHHILSSLRSRPQASLSTRFWGRRSTAPFQMGRTPFWSKYRTTPLFPPGSSMAQRAR